MDNKNKNDNAAKCIGWAAYAALRDKNIQASVYRSDFSEHHHSRNAMGRGSAYTADETSNRHITSRWSIKALWAGVHVATGWTALDCLQQGRIKR